MTSSCDILVGSIDELASEGRRKVKVMDREVLVIYHKEAVYALDLHCFHKGNSLMGGDIENAGGHECIKCPKHRQLIELSTGIKFRKKYKDGEDCGWIDDGCKQRTRPVYIHEGSVYISPILNRRLYPSDEYNPPRK